MGILSRRNFICAVSKDAEESFKKTVEVDRLIDTLREASDKEVSRFSHNFLQDSPMGIFIMVVAGSTFTHLD